MSVEQLRAFDPESLRELGAAYRRLARRVRRRADDVHLRASRLAWHWEGRAYQAAAGRFTALRRELDDTEAPLTAIDAVLSGAADDLQRAKGMLLDALDAAAKLPATVSDDGRTITYTGTEPGRERLVEAIRDGIADALAAAERADRAAADALRRLVPGFDPADPGRGTVPEDGIPAPGTDPATVNTWWRGLSAAERRYLIHHRPERVGNLDGIPVLARDQANRVRLALLDRDLPGVAAIERRLDEPTPGAPQAYLLGFQPGTGRAIVAIGNPDTADHVATYVPGTGAGLDSIGGDIDRADVMSRDARRMPGGEGTSVVLWLGYDAPDTVIDAASGGYAERATGDLRRFTEGLRVTHEGPPSHNTVLGHSYGSTVIGFTAAGTSGIDADELVFVGSPGVGVDHARELTGVSPDHVWATRAEHDIIKRVPDFWFGEDPSEAEFGGRRFDSHPGDPRDEPGTHSRYWDKGNEPARTGMAGIITGNYDAVPGLMPDPARAR